MNGGKRLLSALLALAMVGQLGMVVIGSAATPTDKAVCLTASNTVSDDHGMNKNNRVVTVGSCTNDMHWIGSDATHMIKIGWAGTNFLYPDGETEQIVCTRGNGTDTVKNIIIFETQASLPSGELYIDSFSSTNDMILVPETVFQDLGDGEVTVDGGKLEIGDCIIKLDPSIEQVTVKPLPTAALSISLDSSGKIATAKDGGAELGENAAGYVYLWTLEQGGVKSYFTAAGKTDIPQPSDAGDCTYTCSVVDKATGRSATSAPVTVKEPSCSVTPASITYDGKQVSSNQLFTLGDGETTKAYTFSVAYSGTDCDLHSGTTNHGYTVKWSAQSPVTGVTVGSDNGVVTLDGALSTIAQTVTLQAVVTREGSSKTLTAAIQAQKDAPVPSDDPDPDPDPTCATLGAVTIQGLPASSVTMQKSETNKTISLTAAITWNGSCNTDGHTDTDHGQQVTWSIDGTAPAWAAIDAAGQLTLDGSKMSSGTNTVTVQVSVSDKDNSKTVENKAKITVNRTAVCEKTPSSVEITGLSQNGYLLSASTTAYTIPLSYTVTWGGGDCEIAGHTDTSHGETVEWSIVGTAPAWAAIDAAGKLTLDGSKLSGDGEQKASVQAVVTVGGSKSSPGTAQLTVKRDDASITFTDGPGSSSAPSKEISITSASAATVSSNYYTAPLPDPDNYTYTWTLKLKDKPGASLPGYIDYTPKGTASSADTPATVTITKSKLPATAVNQVFELTVTATPNTGLSQQSLLVKLLSAIMPLDIGDASSIKVASYDITVKAAAGSNSGGSSGGGTTSSSGGSSGSSGSSRYETDRSNRSQWMEVLDDIESARKGSTVKVSLGSNTDMPYYIFEALQGEDISLQMKVSGGYTWTVGGRSVQSIPTSLFWVPLGVKSYSNSKLTALCRDSKIKSFQLENTGRFFSDMRLTVSLGSSYAKKTVYLYSYNQLNNRLTYASSAKVADNGEVEFTFTDSLENYVITSKALYGESAVSSGGGAVGGNSPSVLYPPEVSRPSSTQTPALAEPSGDADGEAAPAPAETLPVPDDNAPVEVIQPEPEPEEGSSIPIAVPLLILAIAGVISATIVVVHNGRGRDGFGIDYNRGEALPNQS